MAISSRYNAMMAEIWYIERETEWLNHVYIEEIPNNKFQTYVTLLGFMLNN